MRIVFAPHLDDEIIGCWGEVWDECIYWYKDYRAALPHVNGSFFSQTYRHISQFDYRELLDTDVVFLPSRYDLHPLHREVNEYGKGLLCRKLFYSVEMNVPWLEEEPHPQDKRRTFSKLYPDEVPRLTDPKYFLFRSVKESDYETVLPPNRASF